MVSSSFSGTRTPMTTLKDVARVAGVSRATVSLVCRNSPLVAAKTRARVEQAMAEVGYVYNRSAANLRSSRTDTIGLVIPEIANPVYAEILQGIEKCMAPLGKQVVMASTSESLEVQDRILQRMLEMRVDGLIISAATGSAPSTFDACIRAGVPVVQVLRSVDSARLDYAGTDNRAGAGRATRHLLSLGHTRLAFLGSSVATSVSHDRYLGYCDALQEKGLGDAAAAAHRLLSSANPPTALVCFNDIVAFGVTMALYERGQEPGRDVSVIGFDNIEWAENWRPALSTMSISALEIGRHAGELLSRRLQDKEEAPQRMISEATLIERRSTGGLAGPR
jgi:LacI family transcriptional regulator